MNLSSMLKTDQTLREHFETVDKKYASVSQQAYYTTLNQKQRQYLRNAGLDAQGDLVFLVFGIHQDNQPNRTQRLYLVLISWLQKQFQEHRKQQNIKGKKSQKFTIVFYNTLCPSQTYSSFKQIFKQLPVKYFDNLKRIIIVNAGFSNFAKGWILRGALNNYLYTLTYHIGNTNDLSKYDIIVNSQFRKMIPTQIRDDEGLVGCSWFCSSNQVLENEDILYRKTIEEEVKVTVKKNHFYKPHLIQYDLNDNSIPIVLELLINRLKSHPQMLEAAGIFRKSVSVDDHIEACNRLSSKNYPYINKLQDPYLIASLIVNIFSYLEQPIFPIKIYQKLANSINKQQDISVKTLKNIILQLPQINQRNLHYLLSFMKDYVITKSQINKMTSYNIAAVLMPGLMRSHNPLQDLKNAKKCVKILQFIIQNNQVVFQKFHKPDGKTKQKDDKIYYPQFEPKNTETNQISSINIKQN